MKKTRKITAGFMALITVATIGSAGIAHALPGPGPKFVERDEYMTYVVVSPPKTTGPWTVDEYMPDIAQATGCDPEQIIVYSDNGMVRSKTQLDAGEDWYMLIVPGDVDEDGKVGITDLVTLAKALADPKMYEDKYQDGKVSDSEFPAADVSGNGWLDITDLVSVAKIINGQGETIQQAPVSTQPAFTVAYEDVPFAPGSVDSRYSVPQDLEALRQEMLERVNAIRAEHGAAPLVLDAKLNEGAQKRAIEIAATGVFTRWHRRPDASSYLTIYDGGRFQENMMTAPREYAEHSMAVTATNSFKSSPGHLRQMVEKEHVIAGFGFAQTPYGSWYVVQHFADGGTEAYVVGLPIMAVRDDLTIVPDDEHSGFVALAPKH